MKIPKTNAARILDGRGVRYRMAEYDTEDGALDGLSVARKTGQDPARVFKTLAAQGGGGIYVFCLPVTKELDLKQAAKAAREKSLVMLPQARLLAVTGYVHGGVSPLGMKRAYPTFLHTSAMGKETILVSAGRVGFQIELAPEALLAAVPATLFGDEASGG